MSFAGLTAAVTLKGCFFVQVCRNVQPVRAGLAPDFPLQTLEGFSCKSLYHMAVLFPETPPSLLSRPGLDPGPGGGRHMRVPRAGGGIESG